ncbi:hypothetical protein N7495_004349 [Penicillium taxi]|uniref:uncharacterized protein n=1 Tax=Penicillium taxi TaxID=168475 RepID=UPI00254504E1|nr:uncharacterized protein N7495_004349 [Penicillium taxi]KAJ5899605.1 hypothetical protein N7495_004349 [Penicillium taxi]
MAIDNTRLSVYLKWVDSWLLPFDNDLTSNDDILPFDEIITMFRDENIHKLLDQHTLDQAVTSFKRKLQTKDIILGGSVPPSCDETNVLSQNYDPRTNCNCTGLYPPPLGVSIESLVQLSKCEAIGKMMKAAEVVNKHGEEWNIRDLFSAKKLEDAMLELALANSDQIPLPNTCFGTFDRVPKLQAPDRRPNPHCDTGITAYNQLYPTHEQVKLCADAKYFFAMACGAGFLDDGLQRAIADSGNDVLIGDYCEAADEKTLSLLQGVGGAAMAFLKFCNLAGILTDWQFDNLVASTIQFRVLGYFRDHAQPRIPAGTYGSRMTGMNVHRHIDVAIYIGIMAASIATGEEISEKDYMELAEVCSLINDLIDFRSDTMRKQRENTVLRGIRGCLCQYLDGIIADCLEKVYRAVKSSRISAMVVMSFCNWAVMASHHKLFELVLEVHEVEDYPKCEYASLSGSKYQDFLEILEGYGTIGDEKPQITRPRKEMDISYHLYRSSPKSHLAWLADSTRSLMDPENLRKILDVVHFEWRGQIGDVEYCP